MNDIRDLADVIRSHRPHGARAYYLQNVNGRFPKQGGWSLDPFVQPVCPSGQYTLAFLANISDQVPLPPAIAGFANPVIPVPELSQAITKAPEKQPPAKHDDPILYHPDSIKNRVDFELTQMADASIKAKFMLTDYGQSLAYAQAWRQEAQNAMQSMSVLQARERERLMEENSKIAASLAEARRAAPPPPPDHFGSALIFFGQIVSLLGKHDKDEGSVLDSLVAGQGVDEEQKAALLATKSELERVKKELAEKQARSGGRTQLVERLAALEAEAAALRESIKSNTAAITEKDEPATKKQSGTNPEKTAPEAENRPQTEGRKTRSTLPARRKTRGSNPSVSSQRRK
ncbi:MAG TPA: hypothetical protein PKE31_12460 [Pseudomonadota bacterium]|jgi:hypothetical protein|nr:hypothetical protein [Pseudomonadota bacterium]